MTQSELITRLAARFPQLVRKDIAVAVKIIVGAMSQALVNGQRIEIRDFGSFCLKRRASREARNPKSGQKVSVPERYAPYFRPGKKLRTQVDSRVA